MNLKPRDAAVYFRDPDRSAAGVLLYGQDSVRIAERRKQVITALVGPEGEAEMRLSRIHGADLRKDPAVLLDGIKATGFFPGARVVFVEDATDGLAPVFEAALQEWRDGDAQVIVTAVSLNKSSKLRKVFADGKSVFAIGIYDDPPSVADVEDALAAAGFTALEREPKEALVALSRSLDPGDFRQALEKMSLYKIGDETPLSLEDIEACAAMSPDAALDDLTAIVAGAREQEIAPILRRLYAQGVQPVALCIGLMRHFRLLHIVASDPGGASRGVEKLRPPIFGPRRDAITRQARHWGMDRLERAISLLTDTDLGLRSSTKAPQHAQLERVMIRLAMMGR